MDPVSQEITMRDSPMQMCRVSDLEHNSPLGYQSDDSQAPTTTSRSSSVSRASLDSLSLQQASVEQAQVLHSIMHLQQKFNWDCGLTCVLMVLSAMGKLHFTGENQEGDHTAESLVDPHTKLRSMCPTTSIWTIDLAHLLSRFGLDVCFLTTTLGPNPAYVNEGFYMPHMVEDERRVEELFRKAHSAGIVLQQRSLSPEELKEAVMTSSCLVIALVDKRKMDHAILVANRSHYDAAIASLPTSLSIPTATDLICSAGISAGIEGYNSGYLGHYVLIVGYDQEKDEYILRDPARPSPPPSSSSNSSSNSPNTSSPSSSSPLEGGGSDENHGGTRISATSLEEARRTFGTDEDLLIVPLPHCTSPPYPWVSSALAAKVHSHQLVDPIDS